MRSLVNFLKSSALYIEENLKDNGEMASHYFESLRNLIIDVGMCLDLVNVVEKIFEIHLLQKKLFVSFQLFLKFFVCLIIRRQSVHL